MSIPRAHKDKGTDGEENHLCKRFPWKKMEPKRKQEQSTTTPPHSNRRPGCDLGLTWPTNAWSWSSHACRSRTGGRGRCSSANRGWTRRETPLSSPPSTSTTSSSPPPETPPSGGRRISSAASTPCSVPPPSAQTDGCGRSASATAPTGPSSSQLKGTIFWSIESGIRAGRSRGVIFGLNLRWIGDGFTVWLVD